MVSYYHRAQFCLLKWWPGWPKFKSGGQSNSEILDNFLSYDSILVIAILKVIFALLSYFWCWPPKFKSDFENIWKKSSNQPIVGGTHLQYVYKHCILKMCTPYYGQIWQFFSYIFRMLNLVIFYHCMTLTVPSWCNLKLEITHTRYRPCDW
jgi:hypothetical protein